MALSVGAKILQIILVISCIVVLISGLLCVGFGAYIFRILHVGNYTTELHAIPIFLMPAGIIVALIGFLGCCGAIGKNSTVLKIFSGILIIILVMELIAAVLLFVYKDLFECCGGASPADWQNPATCCCKNGTDCLTPDAQYSLGCSEVIRDWVKGNTIAVGVALIFLCLIQIGAIVAALMLAKASADD